MLAIERKAWILQAKHQLEKRKALFGDEADVCEGCLEILVCSGPISFQLCQAVDDMMASGLLKGPRKISFNKIRRKFLPIAEDCLRAYGFDGKLVKS